jgi:hypothetical protein
MMGVLSLIDSELVKKYTVKDDGELNSVSVSSLSDLSDDNVYIIVDENARKIFIWKGEKAPVRRKFISAKAAQQMRQEQYGMVYRIDSLDPGLEGREFLSLFGEVPEEEPQQIISDVPITQPKPAPAHSAIPRPAPTTIPRPAPTTTPTPTPSPKPAPAAKTPDISVKQPVSPIQAATSTPSPSRPTPRIVKETEVVVTAPVKLKAEVTINEVTNKLKELEIPPDLEREIIIIGNSVFSAIREHVAIFSKDVVKLEPMDDLPSGIFPASQYQVRLFIENGRVMFIELLRQKTRSERDEFIDDMRKSLQDLSKLGI